MKQNVPAWSWSLSSKPTLLIDGDIFLYRASASTEYECDWGDDVWVLNSNLEEAKTLFQMSLDKLLDNLGKHEFLIAFSDNSRNFRQEINPDYKSKRKDTRKPIVYMPLKAWTKETFPCVERPTLEADDVLGVLATNPKNADRYIVVSDDKDLQTIPGRLYRGGEIVEITEDEADYFWLLQTLTGDNTDGYGGCPGYGPVKAEKALKTNASYAAVENCYLKAGLTKEDCLRNARMARILRHEDWDKENQKVRLWTPENSQ